MLAANRRHTYNLRPPVLMRESDKAETTCLLRRWAEGDKAALEQLTPRVYRELRRIAGNLMRNERPGCSVQATALVHEAYLRLLDAEGLDLQHRAHFLAVAAGMMRHILLDAARKRATAKRGGEAARVDLDEIPDMSGSRAAELLAVDEALTELANVDARKAQVIELRFFGGLTVEETAAVLGVSADTVMRDWRLARAWLLSRVATPGNIT